MHLVLPLLIIAFSLFEVHGTGVINIKTENVKQCGNLTCLHNAQCSFDGKSCQCRRGYQGKACQDDTDECLAHSVDPCFHRGQCHNIQGSWRCDCLQGWRNKGPNEQHCDDKTEPDINDRKCMPGWKGDKCQDECYTNVDCGQNQFCKKHGRGKKCFCKDPGWEGHDCTIDVDECKKKPCDIFHVCLNTPGSFMCTCPTGWQGANCTLDINECTGSPCNNSGTCTNTYGSYKCSCSAGWQGANCDQDVNECLAQPCNSSHVCHNSVGSFTCDEKPELKRVDFDVHNTNIILVAVLGSLLMLLLIILLLVTAKNKRKNEKDKRARTAVSSKFVENLPDQKYSHPITRPSKGAGGIQRENNWVSPQPFTRSEFFEPDTNDGQYHQDRLPVSDQAMHHQGFASYQPNKPITNRHHMDF